MILRQLRGLVAATLLLACSGAAALAGGVSPVPLGSAPFDQAFGSAVGGMLCRSSSGWGLVAAGSANQVLTVPSGGGCPTWANMAVASAGGNVSTTGSPAAGQIAQFTDATHVQGINVLPVSAGGTGATMAAANAFFGGPSSGSASAPTFRALTSADLPSGTGTVTSVALALPSSLFTVSGSPVTGSGTLTGALATQAANCVLAGPASGSAAAPACRSLVPADEPAAVDGCIRISAQSSTVLAVNPYGCNTINIGGVPRVVTPHTCSISSPSPSTLYYVYESWSGTTVTCSFSTTGHITGSDGREDLNSSGSPNTAYRLAGMVYTNTASAPFADNAAFRGVANWFNRQGKQVDNSYSGAQTTSTSWIEYAQVRTTALFWADETSNPLIVGVASSNTANALCYGSFWVNGGAQGPVVDPQSPTANADNNMANAYSVAAFEGVVVISPAVKTNAGTMTITMRLTFSTRI